MLSTIGTAALRLFECQILFSSIEEERTNWRTCVRPIEEDTADNLHTGSQSNGVGWIPSGCMKRANYILTSSNKADVDWASWNALRCCGQHCMLCKPGFMLDPSPRGRQDQVAND